MRLIVGSPGDERQHAASRRQISMQTSARPDDPGRLHRPFRQRPLLETLDSADAVTARKDLKHAERDFRSAPADPVASAQRSARPKAKDGQQAHPGALPAYATVTCPSTSPPSAGRPSPSPDIASTNSPAPPVQRLAFDCLARQSPRPPVASNNPAPGTR